MPKTASKLNARLEDIWGAQQRAKIQSLIEQYEVVAKDVKAGRHSYWDNRGQYIPPWTISRRIRDQEKDEQLSREIVELTLESLVGYDAALEEALTILKSVASRQARAFVKRYAITKKK
ncbi:MAG: hypothetical protein AAB649_04690 [Patescibacteria group bacterium]